MTSIFFCFYISSRYGRNFGDYAIKDIRKGEKITKDNIKIIRPGFSLSPKHYEQDYQLPITNYDIAYGISLKWTDVV